MSQTDYTKAINKLLEKSEEYDRATDRANKAKIYFLRCSWFMIGAGLANVVSFFYAYWILSQ
jgi:hypothetical protein